MSESPFLLTQSDDENECIYCCTIAVSSLISMQVFGLCTKLHAAMSTTSSLPLNLINVHGPCRSLAF